MDVIAHQIINEKHVKLHWDFMEETCRTFGAKLLDKNKTSIHLEKNIVALRHNKGTPLKDFDFTNINTILIGCDDDKDDSWMDDYQSVRIETPVDYYLWSGVALGIVLYEIYNRQSIQLKIKHQHLQELD